MTREDALKRLQQCRDNQPDAWQLIVSRDIVDALLELEPGSSHHPGSGPSLSAGVRPPQ